MTDQLRASMFNERLLGRAESPLTRERPLSPVVGDIVNTGYGIPMGTLAPDHLLGYFHYQNMGAICDVTITTIYSIH